VFFFSVISLSAWNTKNLCPSVWCQLCFYMFVCGCEWSACCVLYVEIKDIYSLMEEYSRLPDSVRGENKVLGTVLLNNLHTYFRLSIKTKSWNEIQYNL